MAAVTLNTRLISSSAVMGVATDHSWWQKNASTAKKLNHAKAVSQNLLRTSFELKSWRGNQFAASIHSNHI